MVFEFCRTILKIIKDQNASLKRPRYEQNNEQEIFGYVKVVWW